MMTKLSSYIISLQIVNAFSFFWNEAYVSLSAAVRRLTASRASLGSSTIRSQISVI